MSDFYHTVGHPDDARRVIRIEFAPKISRLKYGPVRGECDREDIKRRQMEHMLGRIEDVMMLRGVMLGLLAVTVAKMITRYVSRRGSGWRGGLG